MLIFLNLFHKIETKGKLPYSFYEATIILMTKIHKDPIKMENYRSISFTNIDTNILNQTKSKNTSKRSYDKMLKNSYHIFIVG